MSAELPPRIISSIAFVGRGGGVVKSLSGFRRPQHTVPDVANATTNAFLAKLCASELAEESERLFQEVRTGLGYKRKDIALNVASPMATLSAKDFSVEIFYALEEADPSRYRVTTTMRDLADVAVARGEAFGRIFAGRFTEIEFGFRQSAQVEAVIDAIEALDPAGGMRVDYPSDCSDCVIGVTGVDAEVRCTGAALQVVFARGGAPAELIDAFAAVHDAFQISKVLSGLVKL